VRAAPRVVLVAAAGAQAAVSIVQIGLPAIGPELRDAFGLTLAQLGAVLTVNLLGSGVALIAAGVAVDRYGARTTTAAGTALAAAALAAAAFAQDVPTLLAALFVSGVGAAAVPIAGAAALFRAFPPRRRGLAMGIRQTAVPLGGSVAAVMLPGLQAVGGVRLALLSGAAAVALAGGWFALVAEGRSPARAPSGGALKRILRAPGMRRLLLVAAFYIVVLQSLVTFAVPSIRESGLSPLAAGGAFLAINVAAGVGRIVWGRLADRGGGTRRVRTIVTTGWVAAGGGVLFTAALHLGPAAVVPAAMIFAFGALGWNALVYVSAGERTPPELAGRSVAVAATLVFVLSAVCTPLMGALADRVGWNAFWLTTALLAAAGAALALRIPPVGARRPPVGAEPLP
jgi:MFS family permease